jgi:hypothetical protein
MMFGNEPGRAVRYIIPNTRRALAASAASMRGKMAKHAILLSLVLALCFVAPSAKPQALSAKPQANDPIARYTGQSLIRPENYREWIFLSSGLGMNYTPSASGRELFTNVFVPQWSYRKFLATGKWPDKSIFVVEERQSETNGSINKTGHFQTEFVRMGVEVKDETRFPEKWAYFNFDADTKTAGANPKAACWQCHEDHAAVEHTFSQFYPTLKEVAKKFGTYRTAAENLAP